MIWLIGMMGSGKSTIGRALGEALGQSFADSDDEVEASVGLTVRELWEARGEAALRAAESEVVQRLAERSEGVVATGGGVVLDPANVAAMRESGSVVWLQASPPVLAARITGTARPLLDVDDVEARLTGLLTMRTRLYQAAAHHVIDTDHMAADTVVTAVLDVVA